MAEVVSSSAPSGFRLTVKCQRDRRSGIQFAIVLALLFIPADLLLWAGIHAWNNVEPMFRAAGILVAIILIAIALPIELFGKWWMLYTIAEVIGFGTRSLEIGPDFLVESRRFGFRRSQRIARDEIENVQVGVSYSSASRTGRSSAPTTCSEYNLKFVLRPKPGDTKKKAIMVFNYLTDGDAEAIANDIRAALRLPTKTGETAQMMEETRARLAKVAHEPPAGID